MIILKTVIDVRAFLERKKAAGARVGFVPTMGALHEGHISLIRRCKADGLMSVCSIFLNPTQFNDKKDFEKYPVSADSDVELLARAGCEVLFMPSVTEIYPDGPDAIATFDFGYLDTILEGSRRPGHFKGVGQVVARLLQIVHPSVLYLGQKDYQQCMVIRKLGALMGNNGMEVAICPTMREADGLAMSSRNRRLTDPQRALSGIIYQCLISIQSKQSDTDFTIVKKECIELLTAKGFEPEYVALADVRDLSLLDNYNPALPMIALIAAGIGGIRLIDNMLL